MGFDIRNRELLLDIDNNAGTNGTAAFTDSEAQTLLDGVPTISGNTNSRMASTPMT